MVCGPHAYRITGIAVGYSPSPSLDGGSMKRYEYSSSPDQMYGAKDELANLKGFESIEDKLAKSLSYENKQSKAYSPQTANDNTNYSASITIMPVYSNTSMPVSAITPGQDRPRISIDSTLTDENKERIINIAAEVNNSNDETASETTSQQYAMPAIIMAIPVMDSSYMTSEEKKKKKKKKKHPGFDMLEYLENESQTSSGDYMINDPEIETTSTETNKLREKLEKSIVVELCGGKHEGIPQMQVMEVEPMDPGAITYH
ncbi:hypothetical protein ACFL6I_19610 [candidate division KSB1 bacterium]